jgi:cytochrome o ubiquinol oxidase subunit III
MSDQVRIVDSAGRAGTYSASVHGERALGFWFYMMSDAIIFAILFANYAVLLRGTAGGPTLQEVVSFDRTAWQTTLLLTSSLAFGFASIAALSDRKNAALGWLAIVLLLGCGFLTLEFLEFKELIERGAGPRRSGFLSGMFALLGTHGLHVAFGVVGISIMMIQISVKGLTESVLSRLYRLGLFWHFLDIIWIGIFSFVYLPGVMR